MTATNTAHKPAVRKVASVTQETAHLKIVVRKSERKSRETGEVERTGYYVRVTSPKSTSKGLDFSRPKWALYKLTGNPLPEFERRMEDALNEADRLTKADDLAQSKRGNDSAYIMGSF